MALLVGYPINRRAKAVLELAAMLARSTGEELVVCSVLPMPWIPAVGSEDPTFRSHLDEMASRALAQVRSDVPDDVAVTHTTVHASSAPIGLLEAAALHDPRMIVVGSAMGLIERITVSSVADRLLHSSPIPVAVATRGLNSMGGKVKRVTLAFTGTAQAATLVAAALALADRFGAELRLASFAVNLSPPEMERFHIDGHEVFADWVKNIRAAAAHAVAAGEATARHEPQLVIGQGQDWEEALDDVDWTSGDVLVMGSSDTGPVARVFMGTHAAKILRNTPVPVIAVPRQAAEELAE